jgi:signal transduction histidine kinase
MLARFKQGSIRWQIVTLAVFPILLVGFLGLLTQPMFPEDTELTRAEVIAARIALVADQLEGTATAEEARVVMEATRRTGLDMRWVDVLPKAGGAGFANEDRLIFALTEIHGRTAWAAGREAGEPMVIVTVKGRPLGFVPAPMPAPAFLNDDIVNILLGVVMIALPVMLLSAYAARLITQPLIRVAMAAQILDPADLGRAEFDESGPREIRQLARTLNEMRSQINTMLKERTAMLRAVSHDLRTPLTRLKLRVESAVPAETAVVLQRDITAINDMINETLNYLRSDSETEAARNADLPSLLRTICSDFSDIGFNVAYSGPDRMRFRCRSRSLARAVSNLVDNATKHGKSVEITLAPLSDGSVRIEVSDDGPGIPENMLAKVLEPFVKGDPSRDPASRSGFGLGLSIVSEVVRRHGGKMLLTNRAPNGLTAALWLPASAPVKSI